MKRYNDWTKFLTESIVGRSFEIPQDDKVAETRRTITLPNFDKMEFYTDRTGRPATKSQYDKIYKGTFIRTEVVKAIVHYYPIAILQTDTGLYYVRNDADCEPHEANDKLSSYERFYQTISGMGGQFY